MSNHDHSDHKEGNFYKGLFYGVLLGLGVVWFLGTKEGQKVKENLSERGDDLLESVKDQLDRAWREDYDPPIDV